MESIAVVTNMPLLSHQLVNYLILFLEKIQLMIKKVIKNSIKIDLVK